MAAATITNLQHTTTTTTTEHGKKKFSMFAKVGNPMCEKFFKK
jgi:hypothetical protein